MNAETEKQLWTEIRDHLDQVRQDLTTRKPTTLELLLFAVIKSLDSIDSRLVDIEDNTRGTESAVEALEARR